MLFWNTVVLTLRLLIKLNTNDLLNTYIIYIVDIGIECVRSHPQVSVEEMEK
jgi:hypothetical protein